MDIWSMTRLLISALWLSITTNSLVECIACFSCTSTNNSSQDCEAIEGNFDWIERRNIFERTYSHLYDKDCRVGLLNFRAFHCVKIEGVKENGQHLLIRTCSVEDWGSTCGNIYFEHNDVDPLVPLAGCLASCGHDGCNSARTLYSNTPVCVQIILLICIIQTTWFFLTWWHEAHNLLT